LLGARKNRLPGLRYIENNPVKAGLVIEPESFPWSSASQRASEAD